jgi:uncharacterized protein (DUF1330 family)
MKMIIGTVTGFALGLGVAGVLAETSTPYYEVTEINVKDQTAYEASGVAKVRDGIKANGGKIIAGGYDKASASYGAPAGNRFLIVMFPSKEAAQKNWTANVMPWFDSEGHKYVDRFRSVSVEGNQ